VREGGWLADLRAGGRPVAEGVREGGGSGCGGGKKKRRRWREDEEAAD
jgi:hypothetical protein